jgi:hypothetical protein
MKYRAESRLALFASFLLLVAALLSVPVGAAVNEPDCAVLEQWALSIDKKDRWEPLAGNRSWLPRVFQAEDFATLFGVAALDWTVEDTRVIGVHLNDCMKMASRARRYDAQKALVGARNYITGSLKGILVQAESRAARAAADSSTVSRPAESRSRPTRPRAEDRLASRQQAALDEALSELLALPDTTELLRVLGMLRVVDFNDPESYGKTYGRIGLRAGRKLLQALRNLETDTRDPRVAPQLDARYQVLHAAMIDKNVAEIEGLDASLESLQALSRKLPSLQEELGSALTPEDRELLGSAIVDKRLAIQQTILGRASRLLVMQCSNQARSNLPRFLLPWRGWAGSETMRTASGGRSARMPANRRPSATTTPLSPGLRALRVVPCPSSSRNWRRCPTAVMACMKRRSALRWRKRCTTSNLTCGLPMLMSPASGVLPSVR